MVVAFAGVALLAGCGAASDPASDAVSEACGADLGDEGPPAVVSELTPDQIERAKAQGKLYGEDPDLNVMVVETIMEQYGISAEEAMDRAAVEYRSDGADSDVEAAAGRFFGGIWMGPAKYTVAVTEGADVAAVEAALDKRGLLEDSDVVTVRSTYAELERAEERIAPIVFYNPGGRGLTTDVVGNCVIATVAAAFPDEQVDAIEAVGEELGVAILVERVDETAGPPHETGVVTEIDDGGVLEKPADEECGTWVSVSEDTEITRQSGDAAGLSDIAVGHTIDVWFAGGIDDSCPAGAGAAKIVIRDD